MGTAMGLICIAGVAARAAEDQIARGAYLVRAAGCTSCHTDVKNNGPPMAGGRALKTPFGVFYSPNVTPDPETGIGAWSDEEFLRALHEGVGPDGAHYFPVFPFTTYTRMTTADGLAIKAYLLSLPPVRRANRRHEVSPPFGWRFLQSIWKLLFFDEDRFAPDSSRSAEWNRGAYLVTALGHCGECHTPRNMFGALQDGGALAGNNQGPEGQLVANITPDRETGIGRWSEADIVHLLKTGRKPNFDDVQGLMEEVIEDGLKHLNDDDLRAIAVYLKALPPIQNEVKRK